MKFNKSKIQGKTRLGKNNEVFKSVAYLLVLREIKLEILVLMQEILAIHQTNLKRIQELKESKLV